MEQYSGTADRLGITDYPDDLEMYGRRHEIDNAFKRIMNEGQRYQAETLLKMQGARIYDDIHVSGHLSQEGHYQMLDALEPEHIIPAHQNLKGLPGYVELASSEGYKIGRDLHPTANGNTIQLVE